MSGAICSRTKYVRRCSWSGGDSGHCRQRLNNYHFPRCRQLIPHLKLLFGGDAIFNSTYLSGNAAVLFGVPLHLLAGLMRDKQPATSTQN